MGERPPEWVIRLAMDGEGWRSMAMDGEGWRRLAKALLVMTARKHCVLHGLCTYGLLSF